MDLCEFACSFPKFVEKCLDRERRLSKGRSFREESVTDLLTACLMAYRAEGIFVDYPDELATGADMKWRFISCADFTDFTYLVQAKRCRPGVTKSKKTTPEAEAKFGSLLQKSKRRSPTSRGLQLHDLCDQAAPSVAPIVALYSPGRVCGAIPGLSGVSLVDGFGAQALADAWIAGSKRRTATGPKNPMAAKNLQPIARAFSPLFCLSTWRVHLPRVGSISFSTKQMWDSVPSPLDAATFARAMDVVHGPRAKSEVKIERPDYAPRMLGRRGMLELIAELKAKEASNVPRTPEIVFFSGLWSDDREISSALTELLGRQVNRSRKDDRRTDR